MAEPSCVQAKKNIEVLYPLSFGENSQTRAAEGNRNIS